MHSTFSRIDEMHLISNTFPYAFDIGLQLAYHYKGSQSFHYSGTNVFFIFRQTFKDGHGHSVMGWAGDYLQRRETGWVFKDGGRYLHSS